MSTHPLHETVAEARPAGLPSNTARALGSVLTLGAGLLGAEHANAALIVTQFNQSTANGQVNIDIDQDGNTDFFAQGTSSFGYMKSQRSGFQFSVDFRAIAPGNPNSVPYFNKLGAGDVVDASYFGTNTDDNYGHYFGYAYFVDPMFPLGEWNTVGATGYVPLRFESTPGAGYNYGWVEITRGSLIIGRGAFETDVGVAALTPASVVPEPPSLALIAAGAVALAAVRRSRRRTAAQAAKAAFV